MILILFLCYIFIQLSTGVLVDNAAGEPDGQVQAGVGVCDDAAEGGAGDLLGEVAVGVEDCDGGSEMVGGDEEAAGVGRRLNRNQEVGFVVVKPEKLVFFQ